MMNSQSATFTTLSVVLHSFGTATDIAHLMILPPVPLSLLPLLTSLRSSKSFVCSPRDPGHKCLKCMSLLLAAFCSVSRLFGQSHSRKPSAWVFPEYYLRSWLSWISDRPSRPWWCFCLMREALCLWRVTDCTVCVVQIGQLRDDPQGWLPMLWGSLYVRFCLIL